MNSLESFNSTYNNSIMMSPPEESEPEPMFRNITTSIKRVLQAEPTSLRRNPYYYQIYYVYLNTIFASLLPLALLLFFNINTAKELIKMSRLETRSLANRAASVTLRRRSNFIDLNASTTNQDAADVRAALQIAAQKHRLEANSPNGYRNGQINGINGGNEPLIHGSPNGYDCSSKTLPSIRLSEEDQKRKDQKVNPSLI